MTRKVKTLSALDTRTADANTANGMQEGAHAPLDAAQLAKLVLDRLDDDKAENIIEIDLIGKSSVADAMIIASGRSARHVGALADHILRSLKEVGVGRARVEGLPNCDWVLIDAGDVVVHIFRPEVREFYNLERIWGTDDTGMSGHIRPTDA